MNAFTESDLLSGCLDCGSIKLEANGYCASCNHRRRKEERIALMPKVIAKPLQRQYVKKVSDKNVSYGSDGTAYTNAEIAELRRRCYENLDYDGKPPFCSAHGYQCPEWMLDHDHTLAQSQCKIQGKTELIWDENNIEFSCRIAHKEWESYKDGKFIEHKNFQKRMDYLKIHDPEMWERRIQIWEALTKPKDTI